MALSANSPVFTFLVARDTVNSDTTPSVTVQVCFDRECVWRYPGRDPREVSHDR